MKMPSPVSGLSLGKQIGFYFWRIGKIAENTELVPPHGTTQLPLDGFS
jgi:hypothetical protein